MKRSAPAAERNRQPILDVLKRVAPRQGVALEIACGTGQHATAFAEALPALDYQPSDINPVALASASAWVQESALPKQHPAIFLDVCDPVWPVKTADLVICINMIHIAPWSACAGLLAGAGRILRSGGILFLYGPYFRAGVDTAPSNLDFDASLRSQDPSWGVRNLEDVTREAEKNGLVLVETVAMPANNLSVVFKKR
jgi:SAM-dependent methyltransferase